MGQRGRPPVLKDRKTTTVSIEYRQFEFVLKKGIDLSKLVRDTIDVLMQSEETPIEQLNREIEDIKKVRSFRDLEEFSGSSVVLDPDDMIFSSVIDSSGAPFSVGIPNRGKDVTIIVFGTEEAHIEGIKE